MPRHQGVDAFAQKDWAAHTNWCNAPFSRIGQVLAILAHQPAVATLITPFWPSALWWPALVERAGQFFRPIVHDCVELTPSPGLFRPGLGMANRSGVGRPNWRVLALRIGPVARSAAGSVAVPHNAHIHPAPPRSQALDASSPRLLMRGMSRSPLQPPTSSSHRT